VHTPAAHARGDEGVLFRVHHTRLVRVVTGSVNASPQTIEDACGFAWLQFFRHQPDRSRMMSWLVRVAMREVWRLTAEEWRLGAELEPSVPSPKLEGEDRISWVETRAAVAALRGDERDLVLMAAAGYCYDEIARTTGHSRRAVERRLKRARRHLARPPRIAA
jgi:DNA-directed RNA polymerase specialized sigma24 family protein